MKQRRKQVALVHKKGWTGLRNGAKRISTLVVVVVIDKTGPSWGRERESRESIENSHNWASLFTRVP